MFPPGHFLVAFLPVGAYVCIRDRTWPSLPLVAVVFFGSQFPDLIDKPLFHESVVTTAGRVGAHSLPIAIPIGLVALWYAVYTDRPRLGVAFVFAYGSHIFGDFYQYLLHPEWGVPAELFWPFTQPGPRPFRPYWAGPELLFVHLWTVFSIGVLLVAGLVLIRDVAKQSGFDQR